MQPLPTMMDMVKDLFSNIGSLAAPTADYAKRFGGSSADLAKRVGGSSADLAKYVGGSAAVIAKKVGTKRALIGLAVVGAVVGGVILVRYLRARADEAEDLEGNEGTAAERHARKGSRAERKAATQGVTH
ncbi:MAG: hypothetical protein H0T42_08940 [Deltaproteobacteria bacterium]|nr:hypothetical protein [Deltaproteobacteria bacterium]